MKVYRLYRRQDLRLNIEEAWRFFSSPYYLNEITPEFFHVDILSPVPDEIYGGLLIEYAMKAVFGIPMNWVSEISQCDRPHRFIYQQFEGPFKAWSHEVRLSETEHGVILEDIIFYTMPFGWLGRILHKWLIAEKLNRIFDVRRDYLTRRWGR